MNIRNPAAPSRLAFCPVPCLVFCVLALPAQSPEPPQPQPAHDCATALPQLRDALGSQPSPTTPESFRLEGLLGVCEKRVGDPGAEVHLQQAFTHLSDPRLRLQFGVELGDLYYQRGDIDRALPVVREVVTLAPENPDILFFAQHIYQRMSDETMNKLALVSPNSARMQQLIAERLVNAGDLKSAADHYREAIRLDPALPGVHFELAETIVEAAPHDAAAQNEGRAELQSALRVDGESPRIECAFGRLAFVQGNLDAALLHYERGYSLNPREIEAQMGAGRILMAQDKPQTALHYFAEATAQDPLNAEAHYQYGRALKALHRNDEAQQEMKIFETVRKAQQRVRELYRQMNKVPTPESADLPAAEGSQP